MSGGCLYNTVRNVVRPNRRVSGKEPETSGGKYSRLKVGHHSRLVKVGQYSRLCYSRKKDGRPSLGPDNSPWCDYQDCSNVLSCLEGRVKQVCIGQVVFIKEVPEAFE